MAIEKNGQMTYVDEAGNEYLLFPKTKIPQVEGLESALAGKAPASHASDKNNPHGVTIEQIGAAPAGYGLGSNATDITGKNLNDYTKWGVYYWGGTHTNAPFDWGYMEVIPSNGESVTQVARKIGYVDGTVGVQVQRTMNNWGTWGEWKWENPPMKLGVEYRTTERWNDKAVYAKAIDCGALPNTNTKTVAWTPNSGSCTSVIGYGGTTIGYGALPNTIAGIELSVNTANIMIQTNADRSSGTAVVWVRYTKD